MVKLFDTMVQPILTYGGELWGLFRWRKCEFECLMNSLLSNDHAFEKVHIKFCKQSLGVDRQTPDLLARAELGRFPIFDVIIKKCYNYWQHILSQDNQSWLIKALQCSVNMDRCGIMNYYSRFKSLLAILGQNSKIYVSSKSVVQKETKLISEAYRSLFVNRFFKIIEDKVNNQNPGKFLIYSQVKSNYYRENYLDNIHNYKLRKHITGLRCASNILPVNYLRKKGVKRDERFCTMCNNNDIGTEIHTIMKCPNVTLEFLRREFFEKLYLISPQISKLNIEQKFYYVTACIDDKITFYYAIYLDKIYRLIKKKKEIN